MLSYSIGPFIILSLPSIIPPRPESRASHNPFVFSLSSSLPCSCSVMHQHKTVSRSWLTTVKVDSVSNHTSVTKKNRKPWCQNHSGTTSITNLPSPCYPRIATPSSIVLRSFLVTYLRLLLHGHWWVTNTLCFFFFSLVLWWVWIYNIFLLMVICLSCFYFDAVQFFFFFWLFDLKRITNIVKCLFMYSCWLFVNTATQMLYSIK